MLHLCMIKIIRKEVLYYLAILILLALVQHPDLLSSPLERITTMKELSNYAHPFLYTFGAYIIIGIFRIVIKLIGYVIKKFR